MATFAWWVLALGTLTAGQDSWRPLTAPDNAVEVSSQGGQCDQIIRDNEGWIFSPDYPSDYPSNRACDYVVERSSARICHLEMTVIDFDLETTENCFADYLEVDGGQRLCGSLAAGTKKKFPFLGRTLTLRFRSDAQRSAKGFMLQLKQLPCDAGETQALARGDGGNSCDQFLSSYLTMVYSPGYPRAYPPNHQCSITVQRARPSVCRFTLDFRAFDLEYSPACWKDFLELPDGTRLCGSVNPGKRAVAFPLGSDLVTFKFVTDSYGAGTGFDVEVAQIPDSCSSAPLVPIPPGSLIPRPSPGSCDQIVSGLSGRFSSPGFPGPYPPLQQCTLTIRRAGPSVCRVELDIRRLDLERGPEGCSRDFLLLPDRTRICGSFNGKKILEFIGDVKYTFLYFVSDPYRSDWGFEIVVTQIPGSCLTHPPSVCDQKATSYVGRFTSPGYPGDYPPGQLCSYTIRRADPSVCEVELDFRLFDIRTYRSTCSRDFLELPDGTLMCGRTAGSRLLKFAPYNDVLMLRFNSDGFGSGQGFDIFVRQRQNSCSQIQTSCRAELTAATGRLTSPGFPLNYAPRLRCTYSLRRPDPRTCRVRVSFPTFDVEASTHCAKDFLELPDRTRLCGKGASSRILEYTTTREDETLDLHFVTDGSGSGQGFDMQVTQIPNSCGTSPPSSVECDTVVSGRTAVVSSPSYPADYPANAACTISVYRLDPRTCAVRVEFLDFDLEESAGCSADFLEMGGERLCGSRRPPDKVLRFSSGAPFLTISFRSDQVVARRGFQIRLSQVPDSCHGPSPRVCATVYGTSAVIRSEPAPYLPDSDCYFQVARVSPAVCQVSFHFRQFDVGDDSDTSCLRDYLEIQGVKYCGRRSGQTVLANFPPYQNQLTTRFKTDGYDQRMGFIIEVTQLTTGCGAPAEECGGPVSGETFQISSPGFGRGSYPPGLDCTFTLRKSSFDVCALEVRFSTFELEDDCDKDSLTFGDVALCGRLESGSTRTFEFLEDELKIKFKTDGFSSGMGFLLTGNQIKC